MVKNEAKPRTQHTTRPLIRTTNRSAALELQPWRFQVVTHAQPG